MRFLIKDQLENFSSLIDLTRLINRERMGITTSLNRSNDFEKSTKPVTDSTMSLSFRTVLRNSVRRRARISEVIEYLNLDPYRPIRIRVRAGMHEALNIRAKEDQTGRIYSQNFCYLR